MRERYLLLVNQPQSLAFSIPVCIGVIKGTLGSLCRQKNKICVMWFIKAMDLLGKFPENSGIYCLVIIFYLANACKLLTCMQKDCNSSPTYILFAFGLVLSLFHYNLKISSLIHSFIKEVYLLRHFFSVVRVY